MVLVSSSDLTVNEHSELADASVLCPRVSAASCLPVRKAFKDQHVDLTQDLFKLLLLPGVLKCVRFCVCSLKVESLFPKAL